MKKVLFLLLLLFAYSQDGYAQSGVYEELQAAYDQFRKEGKNDSSLTVAKKMNAWALQNETDSSLRYAVSLRYMGNSFNILSLNDSALYFYNKSLAVLEKQQRDESLDAARCLYNLGLLYFEFGDYKVAESYFRQQLEIRKKYLGENHLDYAMNLNSLGDLYSNMRKYKLAEPYYKKALEIRKKSLDENHPDYAISLNNIGALYSEMGDYKSAESYFRQQLEIRKKYLGENDPDYASSLNIIGLLYSDMGDYNSVEPYYKKALNIYKKTLGEDHQDYASILGNLGTLYMNMGYQKLAELYYKQALEIYRKISWEEHPDYASHLGNLGILYMDMGDHKVAELYYKQALEIYRKISWEEHPDYASHLGNLGILYSDMGDYKSAEPYYKQALEIRKRALGEEHPDFAFSLNSLGILYSDMGDYKAAEPYYKQALDIRKKYLGEKHPYYAASLINLGILYKEMGDYTAAELYYKQALEIEKKSFRKNHPEYASSLSNIGILNFEMGEIIVAEHYFKKVLKIRKKSLGDDHPDYASSLYNLGVFYRRMGDYKSAEPYYNQALEIKKKSLGEEHPDYASTEVSYAYLLSNTNREKEAYQILNQNFSKIAKQTADNLEWLTDNQKEAYWKNESLFYEGLSEFANEVVQKVPEAVGLNFNASLLAKSKLLEAKIFSNDQFRQEGQIDLETQELREELGYRRRLLAKLVSEGSLEKSRLDKLNFEVDSLDKRLIMSWPEYAQQKKNLLITWDQVQQNLEEGEAAIEFVRFENKSDSLIYYNALVLKKGDSYPQLIKLCAEQDLQFISPERGFSEYYSLVWQPLEGALQDINTIYYSPTGELYNVPFHAIYVPKGVGKKIVPDEINSVGNKTYTELSKAEQLPDYLMDRYTLHQLTSTRYLAMGLKQKAQEPIGTTLALVGAVNFDYLPGSIDKSRKNKKEETDIRGSGYEGVPLEYLSWTKTEVEEIYRQVSEAGWQTTLFIGNNATKEEIIKLEGKESKEILHLATHGYAFPENDFQDTTISQNSLKYNYRHNTNPMVRSGLILAGGNWAWMGSDTLSRVGAGNGILTALEVSQLNLKKTKLVVLSACETGLGKIEGNEGTFGLKRGFKLAGVEQLIVSLWAVPDVTTQELMALFYSDLTQTKNPTLSFQKAQQAMRQKYPTSPYNWAGFVMVR